MFDPISHLVYVSRGADVRTTIVAGRVLMREGRVRTVDRERVLRDARVMADQVRKAVAK
jgi:5-methylthioadenosine/S-adenosylhomocysteine deaminase